MKTNAILATLLLGVAIFTFGCKQEVATQLAAQQGEWVEITDTFHIPNIRGLSGNTYQTWEYFTGLVIQDTAEFQALATMIDTSDIRYREYYHKYPILLPEPPNFSQYSMVGFTYECNISDTLRSYFFVNDTIKQYRYSVRNISNPYTVKPSIGVVNQNWLRVPRLKQGYIVIFDTTTSNL